jgi:hypothetical protein
METYQIWENSVEVLEFYNYKDTFTDLYQFPHGYKVMDYSIVPRNPFKSSYTFCVIDIVKSFGDIQNDSYYTAEGFFLPEFKEIKGQNPPIERAFDFLNKVVELIAS